MGVFRYLERLLSHRAEKTGRKAAATRHPLAGSLLLCRKHGIPAMALGPFRLALVDDHNPCIGQGCQYTDADVSDVLEATGWSEQKLMAEVYAMLIEMSGGELPELGRQIHSYGQEKFGWARDRRPDPHKLVEHIG